jgi:hypothetical protein
MDRSQAMRNLGRQDSRHEERQRQQKLRHASTAPVNSHRIAPVLTSCISVKKCRRVGMNFSLK